MVPSAIPTYLTIQETDRIRKNSYEIWVDGMEGFRGRDRIGGGRAGEKEYMCFVCVRFGGDDGCGRVLGA